MTRKEINKLAITLLNNKCNSLLFELPTGYGKSKQAIDIVNYINKDNKKLSLLLLVAKRVHKQNWIDEFNKWSINSNINITIECYESFKKYKDKSFDIILLDEIHHINTPIRLEILESVKFKYLLGLSATISKELKSYLAYKYSARIISNTLQDAIDDNILPEPKIYLLPLQFNNIPSEVIIKNAGKNLPIIHCSYANKWEYIKKQNSEIHIRCTKRQYLDDLNSQIEWYKKKYMTSRNEFIKTKWLKLCNDRLKFLSNSKNNQIKDILLKFNAERTLTFCNSIEQTEILGSNCIHSKNSDSIEIYNKFNKGEINHITACNMLNEGLNITNCRIGIYANINASETIVKQRLGK